VEPKHAEAKSDKYRHRSSSRHRRRRHRSDSSSSEETQSSFRRHRIRPRTFDGSGSFETFWAHFENCATYNRWTEADQLAHLKASLTGDAGQVLWDSDAVATDTLAKLIALLRGRYSGSRQSDKYRMELRLRKRRSGESLSTLHQDIRRLMALAHPTLPQEARESIACDYYVDALDDPDFALKVRERAPTSLDEALRVSLQLEAWSRDARRMRNEEASRVKPKARSAKPDEGNERFEDRLTKMEADMQKRLDEILRATQAANTMTEARAQPRMMNSGRPNYQKGSSGESGRNRPSVSNSAGERPQNMATEQRPVWPRRQQ